MALKFMLAFIVLYLVFASLTYRAEKENKADMYIWFGVPMVISAFGGIISLMFWIWG